MCIQFLRPRATGGIEFSAWLVLSSSSGYSKKQVSFFQSVSAYWQALLSALEGNATDCAAAILLRISSRRGGCFLTPDMARRSSQRSAARQSASTANNSSIRATIGVATGSRGLSCTASKNCRLA